MMKPFYIFFLVLLTSNSIGQVNSGLVAQYSFNSGNAIDEIGSKKGTVHGASLTSDRFGNPNKAFSFDGHDDYIDLNSPMLPTNGSDWSFTVWVQSHNVNDGDHHVILGQYISGQKGRFHVFEKENSFKLFHEFIGREVAFSSVDTSWTFLAVTCENNTIKSYTNGVLNSGSSNIRKLLSTNTFLGVDQIIKNRWYKGKIDDLRIYNRSLNPEEVSVLYKEPDPVFTTSVDVAACHSFAYHDSIYHSSGIYKHTFVSSQGCDSFVTLNLTIDTVDVSVELADNSIVANAISANYQWLNCGTNFSPVPGGNSRIFNPKTNGEYAVEVTQNNCVDTSRCISFMVSGISESTADKFIRIYPNPLSRNNKLHIRLNRTYREVDLSIINAQGKEVFRNHYSNKEMIELVPNLPGGYYFVFVTPQNSPGARIKLLIL